MDKKYFDKDLFWRELRGYYNKMKELNCMHEYYEGVCWGLSAGALNTDIISSNTFHLITKLLLANTVKNKKEVKKYANLSEV